MVLPTLIVLPLVGALLVMLRLRSRADLAAVWREALRLGLVIGALRALLVVVCWWSLERGPQALQVFGLLLFVGWPEILLLPRSTHLLPLSGYAILFAVVFAGTVGWLLLLGALETMRRGLRRGRTLSAPFVAIALATPAAASADRELYQWPTPSWAAEELEHVGVALPTSAGNPRFVLLSSVNPLVVTGDFDGDGETDVAVLVRATASGKRGIAIARRSGEVAILGAGTRFDNGGDDFSWLDEWWLFGNGPVERGADESDPPQLRGDALYVSKSESASAIIYFDGTRFRWYQQGD